jgi:hypothetical protein
MNGTLPLHLGWRVVFEISLGDVAARVGAARIGAMRLGQALVFQEASLMGTGAVNPAQVPDESGLTLLERILKQVDEVCGPVAKGERETLSRALERELAAWFHDGQLLTADHLNGFQLQIDGLKQEIHRLHDRFERLGADVGPEPRGGRIVS